MIRFVLGAALMMIVFGPTSSGLAAPGTIQDSAEQEIIRLERDWSEACKTRNKAFLEQLFASEFLLTDYDGATYTKDQEIARTMTADLSRTMFELSDVKVRVYGAVAVVTGLNTVTKDGKSERYRVTDAFVKRNGRWQIVATQSTKKVVGGL